MALQAIHGLLADVGGTNVRFAWQERFGFQKPQYRRSSVINSFSRFI